MGRMCLALLVVALLAMPAMAGDEQQKPPVPQPEQKAPVQKNVVQKSDCDGGACAVLVEKSVLLHRPRAVVHYAVHRVRACGGKLKSCLAHRPRLVRRLFRACCRH